MFTDPLVITINSIANSLPRVESTGRKAVYSKNDGSLIATISHSNQGPQRLRSLYRLDQRIYVADPITSVEDWQQQAVYTVFERPVTGFTLAQFEFLIQGHKASIDSAAIAKIYGQES